MRAPHCTRIVVAVVFAGAGLVGCGQRPVPCSVGRAVPYAARYALKNTEGACDDAAVAALAGDQIGMTTYSDVKDGLVDASAVRVAIRTTFLGGRVAEAEARGVVDDNADHAVTAIGAFADDVPDADGLCVAATLTPTAQTLPALAEDVDNELAAQDAVDVEEVWSDVAVYVDANALGTQMKGTYQVREGTCTATYAVMGVYPAVACADDDGSANDDLCADPQNGINPDFKTVCDPALLLCVLDADVDAALPVLK